ncbi:MAG: ROK family protein [Alistipes sp.]|nr:ROK family protein [Alistipes sp.]
MEKRCFLLLDVGGTFVKSVVATYDGTIIADTESSAPIDSDGPRADIERSFASVISQGNKMAESKGYTLAGVGIAFPGPFDYESGISYMTHKFAALEKVSVRDMFRSFPEIGNDKPVIFMHDVTAAVLGELRFGAGQAFKNVAVVTLGTGLGFAHAINGEIQYAEGGEPSVSLYNRPYRGEMLEDFASKRGFLRSYAEVRGVANPDTLTVAEIGGMCAKGDKEALQSFYNVGALLATELKPLIKEFNIECLLFGGQISRSFAYFEPALAQLKEELPSLKHISPMQNLSTAAPLGLLSRLREELER